jgi:hypothetical protein
MSPASFCPGVMSICFVDAHNSWPGEDLGAFVVTLCLYIVITDSAMCCAGIGAYSYADIFTPPAVRGFDRVMPDYSTVQ